MKLGSQRLTVEVDIFELDLALQIAVGPASACQQRGTFFWVRPEGGDLAFRLLAPRRGLDLVASRQQLRA